MPEAIKAAGFNVAALCPPQIHLARARHLDRLFTYNPAPLRDELRARLRPLARMIPRLADRVRTTLNHRAHGLLEPLVSPRHLLDAIIGAVRQWRPHYLMCGDETVLPILMSALAMDRAGRAAALPADVLEVVRRSLGDEQGFTALMRKSALLARCGAAGLPVAAQRIVARAEDVDEFAAEHGYPVVIKRDFESGGAGVAFSSSPAETRRILGSGNFARVHRTSAHNRALWTAELSPFGPPIIAVQEHLPGNPSFCCIAAHRGKVLASFEADKIALTHPRGPSAILRFEPRPELAAIASRMAELTGFTGIGELELMCAHPGKEPKIIEFNPRSVPSAHLGGGVGADLVKGLMSAFGGPPYESRQSPKPWTVALFPQEMIRDPASAMLREAYHDVPWDDEGLIESLSRGRINPRDLLAAGISQPRPQRATTEAGRAARSGGAAPSRRSAD